MNVSQIRHLFRNVGYLTVGKGLGDVFTFALFVVLSRIFGQEGIGQYSFAMAFSGFFVVFSEFGLYYLSIRELNRKDNEVDNYYGVILSLRLVLSLFVFLILLLVLVILPFSHETKVIIALIGIYQIIYALVDGFSAVCIAKENAFTAGLIESSLRIVTALVGIAVAAFGGSLTTVVLTLPLVTIGQLFVAYRLVVNRYGSPRLTFSLSSLISTARMAVPYAISSLLFPLASRVDVVFLGFFLGAGAVGIYNVAYRVIFLLQFAPYFVSVALLPTASRFFGQSQDKLKILYHQLLVVAVLVGLPVASGLWLIAPHLISVTFGEEFLESTGILRILSGLVLLAFFNHILAMFLMACDRQSERTRSQWFSAWANVGANLCLIHFWGVHGAAIATLSSETFLMILYIKLLSPTFGWPNIGLKLVMGGVGVVGLSLPFFLFPTLPQMYLIPLAMVCYLGTLASFSDIRKNEFPMIMSLVRKNSDGLVAH